MTLRSVPAEHGLTTMHYGGDFEIAAGVLDFEHLWVLPRGAVQERPAGVHQLVSGGRHATYAHGSRWLTGARLSGDAVRRAPGRNTGIAP